MAGASGSGKPNRAVRGGGEGASATQPVLELVLNTGERLGIGAGVDTAALRTVLAALRA